MSTVAFELIFQLLKENKEFPNYQAERRIDIFINYFLARILTCFLMEETTFVCPEFPLKTSGNNRSTKLDYLCKTTKQPVFVELKTDVNSLKESQALSYLNSKWQTCISELHQIHSASKSVYNTKYEKLVDTISIVSFKEENPEIRVVYISPLPKHKKKSWAKINIVKSMKLSEMNFLISEDEKIIWDFILGLELYIYEIGNSAVKSINL